MKSLMLSTALLAATAYGAAAQEATAPATGETAPAVAEQSASTMFRTEADPMEIRASNFIGMDIYSSEQAMDADAYDGVQEGWEDIGEVGDVILDRDGTAKAVLVDIGGFLGIGEREVAVSMDQLRFVADNATADAESDFFLVMNASRAELESAPEYAGGEDVTMTEGTPPASTDTAATGAAPMATDTTTGATATDAGPREGYMAAEAEALTSETLTGAPVYDANDESIGDVSELVLSADGAVTHVIIDVGGFLGIGAKPVSLAMDELEILQQDGGDDLRVYISMSREQLEQLPDYEG